MIMQLSKSIGLLLVIAGTTWADGPASRGGQGATGEAGRITLIVPDAPAAIPGAPGLGSKNPTQRDAAERLRLLIEMATGRTPAIVTAAEAPATGMRIYVGYGPHLKDKVKPPTRPEGLKIQELGGNLYLLGEIAPQGTNNWPGPTDRGLMHAVETYAERVLGYRFLFATVDRKTRKLTELGTVIPAVKSFSVPKGLLIEDAPAFTHRVTSSRPRDLVGLRTGSAPAFFCNHSYNINWWAATFGKTHPEMFIPRNPGKDGKDAATAAMASQPNLRFLDYTEPLLLEKRLDNYEVFFEKGKAPGFYYNPTAKYMVEETIDAAAPTVQYNARSRALFDPKHHAWGNFSNIWFDYLNRMSAAARRRWPDRSLRISTLAYMRHYGVPAFKLAGNIDVMVCMMRTSMGNKQPEVFRKNLGDVKKWSAHLGGDRTRLFLWEYGCWPAFWVSTPILCPNAMQKWLQAVRPMVSGVFFEMYDPNEYYFIMRRLWTRLLWNPDLDVNAEIRDVCERFFGPAGATMTAFYLRLIERYERPWKGAKLTWDQYYLDDDLYFRQSFPPAEIEQLAVLLEKAKRESGLPTVTRKQVAMDSCVHLCNAGEKRVPVWSQNSIGRAGLGFQADWRSARRDGSRSPLSSGRQLGGTCRWLRRADRLLRDGHASPHPPYAARW